MFRIMKQIVAFSGEKKPVLTKAIIVSFIGAVFGALQFLALLLTLEMIIGGKTANALEVLLVMAFPLPGELPAFIIQPMRKPKPVILWLHRSVWQSVTDCGTFQWGILTKTALAVLQVW